MSKRLPSTEEKRLWQQSNKFTKKNQPDETLPDEEELHETESAVPPYIPAPTVKKRVPGTPLSPLSAREAKKQFAIHPYIQATLDLHGLSKLEARELVQLFIGRNHRIGRRHVIIITGKGRGGEGILRAELPHWLNEPAVRPMVATLFHASERDGGTGVMHLILKKFVQ